MEEETKIEDKNISETENGSGGVGLAIFFSGLFSLNLILLLSFFLAGYQYFILTASLCLSIVLGYFFYYQNIKISVKISDLQRELAGRKDTERQENIPEKQREKLVETEKELQEIKREFIDATKKLFAREMELKRTNKKLREFDMVQSEFVSTAAHQLRTPLAGIKWSYSTLLDKGTGPLNDIQKEIAEKGLETIDYAISIINDLLNTARLEEGKAAFNFTEQPIGPTIQEILSQHEETIKEKNIKLVVDVPLNSAFSFRFDKQRIMIVFDNILGNAVKYTPPGGEVRLKSFRREKEIQFKISDTGIGIPQKDSDKVFTKFFRSKKAISFETSGSGLGLYVAKSIIERHGGTITFESEEGKGTTFTITLPLSKNHG